MLNKFSNWTNFLIKKHNNASGAYSVRVNLPQNCSNCATINFRWLSSIRRRTRWVSPRTTNIWKKWTITRAMCMRLSKILWIWWMIFSYWRRRKNIWKMWNAYRKIKPKAKIKKQYLSMIRCFTQSIGTALREPIRTKFTIIFLRILME